MTLIWAISALIMLFFQQKSCFSFHIKKKNSYLCSQKKNESKTLLPMKTKIHICALLTIIILPFTSMAQGTAETSIPSANSIVRLWHEDEMIIYNHDPSGKGLFILWTNGSISGQSFDLPYSDAEVLDFEIIEDTVIFCGVYSNSAFPGAGTCGFVGRF